MAIATVGGGGSRAKAAVMVAQSVGQSAAHLFGQGAHLAGFTGVQQPLARLSKARQVTARQAQVQLVRQSVGRADFGRDTGKLHTGFQVF